MPTNSDVKSRAIWPLQALNFFMADMQAGIGPFLGVFLLAHGWQSGLIGSVMTIGGVAGMVIDLASALVTVGNRNVLSDVAGAAEAARAAAATARVNVEINLAGIADEQTSLEMIADADKTDDIIARAEQVTAAVREQIRA